MENAIAKPRDLEKLDFVTAEEDTEAACNSVLRNSTKSQFQDSNKSVQMTEKKNSAAVDISCGRILASGMITETRDCRFSGFEKRNYFPGKRSCPDPEFSFGSSKRNKVVQPFKVPEAGKLEKGETVGIVSAPKSQYDEKTALRIANVKARFCDTILRAYDKMEDTADTRSHDQRQSDSNRVRLQSNIATAESELKKPRQNKIATAACEPKKQGQNKMAAAASEMKKKRQREREAAQNTLQKMEGKTAFDDASKIQRRFEDLIRGHGVSA